MMPTSSSRSQTGGLLVRDLGRMNYADALSIQRQMQQEVIAARETDGRMALLLVEHDPPVITVSRRAGATSRLSDPRPEPHGVAIGVVHALA